MKIINKAKVLVNKFRELTKKYKYKFDNIQTDNNFYFLEDLFFLDIYRDAKSKLNFGPDIPLRVHQGLWCAFYSKSIAGDIVELGTGKGFLFYNIMSTYYEFLKEKKVYLCDTFLPFKTNKSNGQQIPENGISTIYANSFESVKNTFSEWPNVTLIKGLLPHSLTHLETEINQISFLHVDLNFYKAEVECLDFLWNKITPGGVILLDDFGNPGREDQMKAHIDFFEMKGQKILATGSGQGIVIKNNYK